MTNVMNKDKNIIIATNYMNNLRSLRIQEIYISMLHGMQHQKMYHRHIKAITEHHHLFYSDIKNIINKNIKSKTINKINYNH